MSVPQELRLHVIPFSLTTAGASRGTQYFKQNNVAFTLLIPDEGLSGKERALFGARALLFIVPSGLRQYTSLRFKGQL